MKSLWVVVLVLFVFFCIHYSNGNNVLTKEEAQDKLTSLVDRHVRDVIHTARKEKMSDLERFFKSMKRSNKKKRRRFEKERREYGVSEGQGGAALDSTIQNVPAPYSEMASLLGSMVIQHMDRFGHAAEPHQPFGMDGIHRKKSHDDSLDTHKLTHQQKVALGLESENEGDVGKRNFLTDASILWPQGIIPYEIDSSLSRTPRYVKIIEDAAEMFSNLTCLKWVKRDDPRAQNLGHTSYISFFSESGCWSYVGKVFSNKQQISLQAPWCVTLPITIHEMCHAIGQMHEQSRSDRDNYVTMLWQNIRGGRGNNNMAKSSTLDNNPYDYESVLQYGLYSFSSNGRPSMELTDRRLDFLADSATGLMFYDVQDVIDAYQCTKQCTTLPLCQNGGFVNHRCECFCPSGLTGNLCQSTISTQPTCGRDQILVAPGLSATIQTPNYPNNYPLNIQCVWIVKAPVGMFVKMTIDDLNLSDNGNACYHWLEIQYNLLGQTGPRRCGVVKGITYRTTKDGNSNIMLLKFDSAFAADRPAGKGFKLSLQAVGPGCSTNPCMFGNCMEADGGSYTCNCDSGWQGRNCDTPDGSLTLTCGFETGSVCFMDNMDGDDFDWTIHLGPTPSKNTGPSAAKDGINYLYTEMSSPQKDGDTARYETMVNLQETSDRCLGFWFYMYGSAVGTLNIYTYTASITSKQILWTKSKEQGQAWLQAAVTIPIIPGVKIGFEMVGGPSWSADVAIDSVSLSPGPCTNIPPTPTMAPSTTKRSTTTRSTPSSTTTCSTTPFVTTPIQDPCNSRPCFNGATCMSQPGSNTFWCQCAPMYTGLQCEISVTTISPDPCFSQPCLNNGTCNSSPGALTFWCTCSYPWTGPICETPMVPNGCYTHRCQNNATCYSDPTFPDGYFCACDIGWSGLYCEMPIASDPCMPNPCMNNGSCYSDPNSLTGSSCLCPPDWSGFYCEMPTTNTTHICSPNPCMNNGTCYTDPVSTVGFSCYCQPGWSGLYCEMPITSDPCMPNPCMNNGSCYLDLNSLTGSSCLCPPDWSGYYCEMPTTNTTHVCSPNPCMNNGTCYTDPVSTVGFSCYCLPGWSGLYCDMPITSDPCIPNPCMNNGSCYSDPNSLTGSSCLCPPDWSGFYCEMPTTNTTHVCSPNPCMNNGTCYTDPVSTVGFSCYCQPGWSGLYCEMPITTDPCIPNPCMNNGSCYSDPNSLTGSSCFCPPDWSGFYCEMPTTNTTHVCSPNPCMNNGTCYTDPVSTVGFSCSCLPGWSGLYCEMPLNPVDTKLNCSVEDGEPCFLKRMTDKDFMWKKGKGSTRSHGTGPSGAHGGQRYYYIETSSPRKRGDEAWLKSSELYSDFEMCLTFFYHAYGLGVGSLIVYYAYGQGPQEIWRIDGDQGNAWHKVNLRLAPKPWSKVYFSGVRGRSYTGDIAIDDISVIKGPCDGLTPTIHPNPTTDPGNMKCSFEKDTPCFLKNSADGDFDWKRKKGRTPSRNTGPKMASEGEFYSYIEATGKRTGKQAILESGYLPNDYLCLHFMYSMYGSGMGELSVEQESADFPNPVFHMSGNQGEGWHQAVAELIPLKNSKLKIFGIRGTRYTSDIAIDDIHLDTGKCLCASNPCQSGGICTPDPGSTLGYYCSCPPEYTSSDCSVLIDSNMHCGFEQDTCQFHQSTYDDFDWTRKSGRTRTSGTGPGRASNGEYYLYIESSNRKKGEKAVLESYSKIMGSNCVVMEYHMFGKNVGELNISISNDTSGPIALWTRKGSLGNSWKTGAVQINSPTPYRILVSASVGSLGSGDIAIDDLEVIQGTCGCASSPCLNGGTCHDASGAIDCQCHSGYTGLTCETLVAGAYRCDFSDPDNCFLKNTGGDDFDWSFGTSTPSHKTGPSQPHDGQFAYIEASHPRRRDDEAILTSKDTNIPPGDYCLQFLYNMYGQRMGSLSVVLGTSGKELWRDEGDQGTDWHLTRVDIPFTANEELEIIAERGRSYKSDAAIDEVILSPGQCIHNSIR